MRLYTWARCPCSIFRIIPQARAPLEPFHLHPRLPRLLRRLLLSSYLFYLSDDFDGAVHVDYRTERGVGLGPDLNYNLGGGPRHHQVLLPARPGPQRHPQGRGDSRGPPGVWFSYQAMPATNLQLLSVVRYQSDLGVTRDFFESEYRQNRSQHLL